MTFEVSQLTAEMVSAQATTTAAQIGEGNNPTPAEAAIAGKVLRKYAEQATATGGEQSVASLMETLAQWGAGPTAPLTKAATGPSEAQGEHKFGSHVEKPPAAPNISASGADGSGTGSSASGIGVPPEQLLQEQLLANKVSRSTGKAEIPRAPLSTADQPPTSKQRTDRNEEPDPPDFPAPMLGAKEPGQTEEPAVRE